METIRRSGIWTLLIVLALGIRCMAQTASTGALTGSVTDPTGAAIPNATVILTSLDNGQERPSTTGSDGVYRFTLVPPGNYKVRFAATGFKSSEVSGIKVSVTETPVLDRRLEIGAQAEQVTVEANVENLQTTSSTLGTVVGANTATAIPLTTRNYTNLLGFSAGAVASVNNASGFGKGGMEIAVNGASNNENNFSMDGVSITGTGTGQVTQGLYGSLAIPNPDTLQEFKIQTSLYDAGYGRNPGANVNVITKSGTNAVHGTAFEFFRNVDLNATDFFRNRTCGVAAGAPTPLACAGGVKQVLNQNQFGGTFGGPIKKDKLFVFAAYQQTWQKNGASSQGFASGITLFPIPNGNRGVTSLAGVNDAAANAFQTALGAAFCNSPTNPGGSATGGLNDPSRGMQVHCNGDNINPYALRYLQAKNSFGNYAIPGSGTTGNFAGVTYTIPAYDREYQGMLNLDYIVTPKHTFSSRYFISAEPQDINFFGGSPLPGLPGNTVYGYQNVVLKLTSILSNTMVNELRGSVIRSTDDQTQSPPSSMCANNIYPNVPPVGGILGGYSCLPPILAFPGAFTAFGGSNDIVQHITTTGFGDQVSWTKGKHTMRFGGEFESTHWGWVGSWITHGLMNIQTFSDFLIGLPGGCGSAVLPGSDRTRPQGCNGSPFSNILNSATSTVRAPASGIVHNFRLKNADLFFQDDFKVNRRLTLNLGLRWEYDGSLSDKYGNLSTMLPSALATVPLPATTQTPTPGVDFYPAGGTCAGWVVPANYDFKTWGPFPNSTCPGIVQSKHDIGQGNDVPLNNFAPRVGFAWQPTDSNKFVIRGGGGLFYDRVPGNTLVMGVIQSSPYAPSLEQGAATNQFSSLAVPFQSTPLGAFPARWVNFQTNQTSAIQQLVLADRFLTPLVYSWNMDFQYEFKTGWVLDVGYVGSHGIHLSANRHIVNGANLATAAAPLYGIVTTNTVANAALRVPYLGLGPTGMALGDTVGSYKYNSLQATVRKQLSRGLTFQAAYTFSRAFTNETSNGLFTGPNLGDPRNLSQQYGLNSQYRPHRVVLNYSWDIPGQNLRGMAGTVLGRWSLAGVTTIQSGQWMSILDSRGGSIFGLQGASSLVSSRAQMAPGSTYADLVTSGDIGSRLGGASGGPGYFNRLALSTIPLAVAPDGTLTNGTGWGNSGVGVIEGPGQFNFDVTVAKNTRVGGIHEDAILQFRAEFFNLLNHPQFANPANDLAVANFGQITSTTVNPRLIQFALKYVF